MKMRVFAVTLLIVFAAGVSLVVWPSTESHANCAETNTCP